MNVEHQKIIVVKIGGSILGSHDTTLEDLAALQREGIIPVVVHGGGKVISQWMERQGGMPRFIRGLRVTDAQGIEVVVAVLAGVVNKSLVASLTKYGAKVVGISGADGGIFRARIADSELGLVGEIVEVNPDAILLLRRQGYMPLVAPVAINCSDAGMLLNINADTAAGRLAGALMAERLIFLSDVPGIMDYSQRRIPRMTATQAREVITSGVASGGMIPKIEACLAALPQVKIAQIVDGREPHILAQCLAGKAMGTRIG